MLAVTFAKFGGPEVLRVAELPQPTPDVDEVVVKVTAASINPTDLLMLAGEKVAQMADLRPPYIAGMEFSGVVHSVGSAVSALSVGQSVFAVVNPRRPAGGAHAEYVCVPAASVAVLALPCDLVEAATVPMNGLTASTALALADLIAGDTLLVTGAAGVLGGYVIELAKRAGLIVIADAKESDVPWLQRLGADAIVPRGDAMDAAVRQLCADGVHGVVDAALLGERVGPLVRSGGAAVSVNRAHPIDDRRLRQHFVASIERMRDTETLQKLSHLLHVGGLTTRAVLSMPIYEAARAHRLAGQKGLRGRIVLTFGA